MRGPRVLAFQQALCSLGFEGPVDGVYGDATYVAFWAWLSSMGRVPQLCEAPA